MIVHCADWFPLTFCTLVMLRIALATQVHRSVFDVSQSAILLFWLVCLLGLV